MKAMLRQRKHMKSYQMTAMIVTLDYVIISWEYLENYFAFILWKMHQTCKTSEWKVTLWLTWDLLL